MNDLKNKKEPPKGPLKSSKYDPMGMYTGTPLDEEEKPQQDADDL